MLWLKVVDDFDYGIHEGCTCNVGMDNSEKDYLSGDRVVVYKQGEQKVVAIGTIINGRNSSGETDDIPCNGLNLRYDFVNQVGITAMMNGSKVLSDKNFEHLFVRLVRGY